MRAAEVIQITGFKTQKTTCILNTMKTSNLANYRLIMTHKLERTWMQVKHILRYYFSICPEGVQKTIKSYDRITSLPTEMKLI
jgi:hypothetical protein